MDHHGQEHAYGVHYDVALANPLPAGRRHSPRAPFFRGSHRLTVDDRGAGGRVSTLDGPHRRPPGLLDAGPGVVLGPAPEIFVHSLPRGQIVRPQAQGAAAPPHIQYALQHFPQVHGPRSATRFGRGQQRSQQCPLGVG